MRTIRCTDGDGLLFLLANAVSGEVPRGIDPRVNRNRAAIPVAIAYFEPALPRDRAGQQALRLARRAKKD